MVSNLKKYPPLACILTIFIILISITGPVSAADKQDLKPKIWLERNGDLVNFNSDMVIPVQENIKSKEVENLPEAYDLRDVNGHSYVNPPEYQNPWGCCWAFGALSAAESNALLKGAPNTTNFSKRALTWYSFQLQGSRNESPDLYEGIYETTDAESISEKELIFNGGGNGSLAQSQLSTWNGSSTAEEALYQNDEGIIDRINPGGTIEYSPIGTWSLPYPNIYNNAFHLQNSTTIDPPNHHPELIADQVKALLMKDGALFLGFGIYEGTDYYNGETNAQYVSSDELRPNHAVSIVGWDDNYQVTNFNAAHLPPGPGAWICKNNWSPNFGDNGYFYLSYYDKTIYNVVSFDVEVPGLGYSYDNNYQYDYLGNRFGLSCYSSYNTALNLSQDGVDPYGIKAANIFTAKNAEILKAISVNNLLDATAYVTTQIYKLSPEAQSPEEGELVLTQTDEVNLSGFYTLPLVQDINLQPGERFAVVQNTVYLDFKTGNETLTLANLPIEYGLDEPIKLPFKTSDGKTVNQYEHYKVTIEPGESFVTGIGSQIGEDPNEWIDVTDPKFQEEFQISVQKYLGSEDEILAHPGNVMLKAYTTDVNPVEPVSPEITVNHEEDIYLTTPSAGTNTVFSVDLSAEVSPADSNQVITWSVGDSDIASLSNVSGNTTTITGTGEGKTTITVTAGTAVKVINIICHDGAVISDGINVSGDTPDYFSVLVSNVRPNPAYKINGESIEKVSIFCWSELSGNGSQSDLDAKVARRIPGTNDWIWENFSVNNNAVNNYFLDANNITINVYGSTDPLSDGNLINVGQYDWVNTQTAGENSIAYIAYAQDLGFIKPTVFDGSNAGTIGSLNLEGVRVSSNISEVAVITSLYVQSYGWLPDAEDGFYTGTMNENLPVEGLKFKLEGSRAQNYTLKYRVYQFGSGWGPWVYSGQLAGSEGQSGPIQAFEINLIPSGN